MVDPVSVKRPCGYELKTKVWKQGSSITCTIYGYTVVSSPAPKDEGYMKARIEEFCEGCKQQKEVSV